MSSLQIIQTALEGVVIVKPAVFADERGFFLESFHHSKFASLGLPTDFVQDNHSRSRYGVLRGIHFQDERAPMDKLVRCTLGRIFDVAVDLRVGSPTFSRWVGVELSSDNFQQLLVPSGFGHGFVVLSDVAEVQYKCTGLYTPEAEGAIRWDDRQIGIEWPVDRPTLSPRDQAAITLEEYLEQPAFIHELERNVG